MDLKINKNNKDKKFKKGKVYIIYYYPPDILITEDPELKKLFRGSKDKWTIIDEKGQEYSNSISSIVCNFFNSFFLIGDP